MPASTPRFGSAPTQRLRPWRARLVVRRGRVQWQLLVVVTAIAVLACSLISSLALLAVASEQSAVRGALGAAAAAEVELRVTIVHPDGPVSANRHLMADAVVAVVGDAAASTTESLALSELYFLPSTGRADLLYLGELEAIADNSALTGGEWPDAAGEIAIPANGAAVLGVGVGDSILLQKTDDEQDAEVTITGIYSITDPAATFWNGDLLGGAGHDPEFPVPGSAGLVRTDAIGPLIVPEGTLAAEGIAVERLVLRVVPQFEGTTVQQLSALQARLNTVSETVPVALGDIGDSVEITTRLPALVSGVSDALAITRSTVVVVSLLLFVLAVAALGQAARLLTEARAAERHLMRARGASVRQVFRLAAIESAFIVGAALLISPFLARLVYLLVAQQPAMAAAGMAVDPGVPITVWVVAAMVAGLFWLLLVAPLLGREGSFHEGEQGKARQRRFSGLQRSGVDIAVLVLAIVAYAQLQTYHGPSSGSGLGVDPILVAGPALVMLAGALLAVRLIPIAAKLTDRLAEHSSGAVLSLAAWEIGRRAQRATAAILLLTIALAAGSFSLAFLATWRQSQIDQSAFAVGAPLRLTSDEVTVTVPDAAQPVLRSEGYLAGPDERPFSNGRPNGEFTSVLGLTAAARELLDSGRVGVEGGTTIAGTIADPAPITAPIELPDDTLGLSATVKVSSETPLEGIQMTIRVLVEDDGGHQTVIDMGSVYFENEENQVRGYLPSGQAENNLRLVGVQAVVFARDPNLDGKTVTTKAQLLIRDLTSIGTPDEDAPAGTYPARPIEIPADARWRATGTSSPDAPKTFTIDDWQLGLTLTVPRSLDSKVASYSAVTWPAIGELPAVLSQPVAKAVDAVVGDRLTLIVSGVPIGVKALAITQRVPGGGTASIIGSLGVIGRDAARTVVVDEVLLSRALFEAGVAEPQVREWWIGVEPTDIADYVNYLAVQYDAVEPQSAVLLAEQMQEDPLRVATQGALWLVVTGAAALAAVGFAVHATGSLRSRVTEFAQLRAVGLSRRRLVGVIGIESLLLCGLGTAFGLGLGVLLAYLVGPLVGVSGDGSTPVPAVSVQIPAAQIALLAAELAVVLAVVVLVAARVQRVAQPASALRRGEER